MRKVSAIIEMASDGNYSIYMDADKSMESGHSQDGSMWFSHSRFAHTTAHTRLC